MSTLTFEAFMQEAITLPSEQRTRLASRLLESLDDEPPLSDAWRQAVHRRAEEIDAGSVQLLDHADVMKQARDILHPASPGV